VPHPAIYSQKSQFSVLNCAPVVSPVLALAQSCMLNHVKPCTFPNVLSVGHFGPIFADQLVCHYIHLQARNSSNSNAGTRQNRKSCEVKVPSIARTCDCHRLDLGFETLYQKRGTIPVLQQKFQIAQELVHEDALEMAYRE
jgi:hypothetical protein